MIPKNVKKEETKVQSRAQGFVLGLMVAFITFCVTSVFIILFGDIHYSVGASELLYVGTAAGIALPVSIIAGVIGYIVLARREGNGEANAQATAIEAGKDDTQSADENLEAETKTQQDIEPQDQAK